MVDLAVIPNIPFVRKDRKLLWRLAVADDLEEVVSVFALSFSPGGIVPEPKLAEFRRITDPAERWLKLKRCLMELTGNRIQHQWEAGGVMAVMSADSVETVKARMRKEIALSISLQCCSVILVNGCIGFVNFGLPWKKSDGASETSSFVVDSFLQHLHKAADETIERYLPKSEHHTVFHGIAAGVLPEFRFQGLNFLQIDRPLFLSHLVEHLGMRYSWGEAVSPITHAAQLGMEKRRVASVIVPYNTFEHKGQRPFSSVDFRSKLMGADSSVFCFLNRLTLEHSKM
jgi:hypothetical protein